MTDESQTPDQGHDVGNKVSEVIAEALSSMREDEMARTLADALENAWGSGKFNVEVALREITAGSEEEGGDSQG